MSKIVKYSTGIFAVILILYLSLDIQSLEKHRNSAHKVQFKAADYALKFWNESLPGSISLAQEAVDLQQALKENPGKACEKYGHKLGISKTSSLMVKGKGMIERIEDEYLTVILGNKTEVKIATAFIFGNEVRDGSGKVNIDDFMNMTDFNNVTLAINQLVKEKVVAPLKKNARVGKMIEFAGAMEISEENYDPTAIRIIPVSAKLSDGKSE